MEEPGPYAPYPHPPSIYVLSSHDSASPLADGDIPNTFCCCFCLLSLDTHTNTYVMLARTPLVWCVILSDSLRFLSLRLSAQILVSVTDLT